MDKFGLFSLLSALTSPADGDTPRPAEDPSAAPPSPPAQNENRPASPPAGFFSPDERLARAASLLERHNAISRRIDRKNGK